MDSCEKLVWLDFEIDLELGKLVVPNSKLERACELLRSLVDKSVVSARRLASAIGKIQGNFHVNGLRTCCVSYDPQSIYSAEF